jgi:hypothetical protein
VEEYHSAAAVWGRQVDHSRIRQRTRKQSTHVTAITSKTKGTLKNRLKKLAPLIGGAAGVAALAVIAGRVGYGPIYALLSLVESIPMKMAWTAFLKRATKEKEKLKDKDKEEKELTKTPANKITPFFHKYINFGLNLGGGRTGIGRLHAPVHFAISDFLLRVANLPFTEVSYCRNDFVFLSLNGKPEELTKAAEYLKQKVAEIGQAGGTEITTKFFEQAVDKQITELLSMNQNYKDAKLTIGFQFVRRGGLIKTVYLSPISSFNSKLIGDDDTNATTATNATPYMTSTI